MSALWLRTLLNRPADPFVSKETFLQLLGLGVYEEIVLDLAVRPSIFYLMLPYQKVLFGSGTSLASELAQEKWLVCLQVDLLKICSSFPARREAQSRTWLCGACTEPEQPWETSRWALQLRPAGLSAEPAGASMLEQERLPRQWKKSFVSHHVVQPAIAPVEEWCSGVVVAGWSPVPSQLNPLFQGAPNGADTKSQSCFQRHGNSMSLCGEWLGPLRFASVLPRDFRIVPRGFSLFPKQQLLRAALNDAEN